MKASNFNSWLETQKQLLSEAAKLIDSFKFKYATIDANDKNGFIRMFIGTRNFDFHVKRIKSKFAKSVWLCKEEDFKPQDYYLLFLEDQSIWKIAYGQDIVPHKEVREGEYKAGVKYVVIPLDVFVPAKMFFKDMQRKKEEAVQTKLG